PKLLLDVIEEDVIYSYDVVGDTGEYIVSADGSCIAIVGLSMIRHGDELSVILLAGENPPYPPDNDLSIILSDGHPSKGHESVSPSSSNTLKDRYLSGLTNYSKILLLTRFNLLTEKHDLRYINIDTGQSFLVFSDDTSLCDDIVDMEVVAKLKENNLSVLKRYSQLFSALTSLIYLPVFFIDEKTRVINTNFITELETCRQHVLVQQASNEFERKDLIFNRSICCMKNIHSDNGIEFEKKNIKTQDFQFESSGFWKSIRPHEIGEDKNGNPIVGKTWVERRESCSVKCPESFVLDIAPQKLIGSDPGIIYIIRSPSHGIDIYKIGLTRRHTDERASEISSATGVPIPFDVLANWNVKDCRMIEKEVHKQLEPYRLNRRREFFRTSLSNIIKTIEQVITDSDMRT
ncbi:GIY-YIG nuclease family protein, partial [bacterium]|nr:GIY-YIG nuclease family protein [bacterium]